MTARSKVTIGVIAAMLMLLIVRAATFRSDMTRLGGPVHAAKLALRALARRIQDLTIEAEATDAVARLTGNPIRLPPARDPGCD